MRILTLLASCFLACSLQAQTLMPASTIAAINVIQKDLRSGNQTPSNDVLKRFPVYHIKGNYYVSSICKINSAFDKNQARADGFLVGAITNQIASLRIPISFLTKDFSYPGINYLQVAAKISPDLDQAVVDVKADSVNLGYALPQPYTGKNVIIGICDWGFDFTHPTFYDTSLTFNRILAVWDQVKTAGTSPTGFGYGVEYPNNAAVVAAEHDTSTYLSVFHGTHVAGIAGGSGGGTNYRSAAYESDLLFTQLFPDNASAMDAFQWMSNIAQTQGKRLVINNSWNLYSEDPLDGTSLLSQAIDAHIDSGIVFVNSGSNNGAINFHIKKSFSNDSMRTRITGFSYTTDSLLWGQQVVMWGEPGRNFNTRLRILDAGSVKLVETPMFYSATSPAFTDTFMVTGVDTIWYRLTIEDAHPLNGAPNIMMDVRCLNSTYKCVLYTESDTGIVHCWNLKYSVNGPSNKGYAFQVIGSGYTTGDKNYGVGHPGITNNVITAASHVSMADISSFSSYGPRIDEVLKPDISAPGSSIGSALNSFAAGAYTAIDSVVFMSKTYKFFNLSGTSMSSPMTAAVSALILEANPTVSPSDLKQLIINYARTDSFTGIIPLTGDTRWGWGKLDAYAAIKGSSTISVNEMNSNGQINVFPNPTGDFLNVSGKFDGTETFDVFSLDGKKLDSGTLAFNRINLSEMSNGIYLLTINCKNAKEVYKIIKN